VAHLIKFLSSFCPGSSPHLKRRKKTIAKEGKKNRINIYLKLGAVALKVLTLRLPYMEQSIPNSLEVSRSPHLHELLSTIVA